MEASRLGTKKIRSPTRLYCFGVLWLSREVIFFPLSIWDRDSTHLKGMPCDKNKLLPESVSNTRTAFTRKYQAVSNQGPDQTVRQMLELARKRSRWELERTGQASQKKRIWTRFWQLGKDWRVRKQRGDSPRKGDCMIKGRKTDPTPL